MDLSTWKLEDRDAPINFAGCGLRPRHRGVSIDANLNIERALSRFVGATQPWLPAEPNDDIAGRLKAGDSASRVQPIRAVHIPFTAPLSSNCSAVPPRLAQARFAVLGIRFPIVSRSLPVARRTILEGVSSFRHSANPIIMR